MNNPKPQGAAQGFTLLELLVVIAVIGLLSGIVLYATGSARDQAKDARIEFNMAQLLRLAELTYGTDDNYDAVHCGVGSGVFQQWCDDIGNNGGTKPSDGTPGIQVVRPTDHGGSVNDRFCAKTQLNSGLYWCIDSEYRSKEYTTNPLCRGGGSPIYTCE